MQKEEHPSTSPRARECLNVLRCIEKVACFRHLSHAFLHDSATEAVRFSREMSVHVTPSLVYRGGDATPDKHMHAKRMAGRHVLPDFRPFVRASAPRLGIVGIQAQQPQHMPEAVAESKQTKQT